MRRSNAGLGILHLVQGVAMLALASAFSLPVTGCPWDEAGRPDTLGCGRRLIRCRSGTQVVSDLVNALVG